MSTAMSLLDGVKIRSVAFRNRIGVSPMCMYSCENKDGVVGGFHVVHLGARAVGSGVVVTEATAVAPEGRISLGCPGMWSDAHVDAWRPVVREIKRAGAVACMQLAHAGRKAGTRAPWDRTKPNWLSEEEKAREPLSMAPVAPTAEPFRAGMATPAALTLADIAALVDAWRGAARRCLAAGFDAIELHFAHGYLVSEFYSPLVNTRTDAYGGDFAGRCRLAVEIATAVREVWPADLPLFARINASDWADDAGGWTVDDAAELARLLGRAGVDVVDVSSGGMVASAKYGPVDSSLEPGYQAQWAGHIRRAAGVRTCAVGLITTPQQADAVVAAGLADFVFVGRAFLYDPHWALHAVRELKLLRNSNSNSNSNNTNDDDDDPEAPLWPLPYAWAVGPRAGIRRNPKIKL